MFWNKTYFQEAGLSGPPATFPELIEDAKKLVKFDSQGRMTRSGISLRLSGQGSGIGEKFRYVLEAAGGSLIDKTPSRQMAQRIRQPGRPRRADLLRRCRADLAHR